MWDVDTDLGDNSFPEAVAWFRERVPMTAVQFAEVTEHARRKAFKVAGVSQLEVVTEAWAALDAAIDEGTDLRAFVAAVGDQLEAAWGRPNGPRLENIFRTNVQSAYGAGRMTMQDDPAIREARPFRRFVAVLDSRTSQICGPLNGTVLPSDDSFWLTRNPPLHFQCRSTVITLTPEQAEEFGVADKAPDVEPLEGFGNPLADYEPDLSGMPAPLVAQYRARSR